MAEPASRSEREELENLLDWLSTCSFGASYDKCQRTAVLARKLLAPVSEHGPSDPQALEWPREIVAAYDAGEGPYTVKCGTVAHALVRLFSAERELFGMPPEFVRRYLYRWTTEGMQVDHEGDWLCVSNMSYTSNFALPELRRNNRNSGLPDHGAYATDRRSGGARRIMQPEGGPAFTRRKTTIDRRRAPSEDPVRSGPFNDALRDMMNREANLEQRAISAESALSTLRLLEGIDALECSALAMFIRGGDIPNTIEAGRVNLVKRMLAAEADVRRLRAAVPESRTINAAGHGAGLETGASALGQIERLERELAAASAAMVTMGNELYALRTAPVSTRRFSTKDAEAAIDLFLEYRDKYGHDDEAAKVHALIEFDQAQACEPVSASGRSE